MTRVDALVIPFEVESGDVDRELRRRDRRRRRGGNGAARTTTGAGQNRGRGGAAIAGGVAGVVVGAITQNDAVSAVLGLVVNLLGAALLPLLLALLPLLEALAPVAGLLLAGLTPLVGLLVQGVEAVLNFLGADSGDSPVVAVLKAAGRGLIGGALLGGAAGSIIPGAGTVSGAIVGGSIGAAVAAVQEAIEQTQDDQATEYSMVEVNSLTAPEQQEPWI